MAHLLAIDLGTGSCRAILFEEDGGQVAVAQREWSHPALPGVPGSQVFETARNWPLLVACVREALAAGGVPASDVAAVSSTSMREGMVLYDAGGAEIWACPNVDSRASAEADALVESGAARRIFERGGDWVSITSPARFLWIRDHEPEVFRSIAHVGMLSDWVLYRLTGRFVTDPSSGSSSNLFELDRRTWSGESLAEVGLSPAAMPEVLEPGTVVGGVTAAAAEDTGLAPGTPVVVGGADTQLGLVGIGVVAPGRLTLVGGSFWQLTVVTDRPLIDPEARVRTLCHAVPGQWMTEGIGFYCGIAMRWFRDAFCEPEVSEAARRGIDGYAAMEEAARRVPAGANGLLAVFSNVMNVRRWVQASPSFLGFDVDDPARTGRAACIRALEEQAAFASRGHLAILEELTARREGHPVAADRGRCARPAGADPGCEGVHGPRCGDVRRHRGRHLPRRGRGRRAPGPLRADRRTRPVHGPRIRRDLPTLERGLSAGARALGATGAAPHVVARRRRCQGTDRRRIAARKDTRGCPKPTPRRPSSFTPRSRRRTVPSS
jgi:autoinducer 2 (AI-2) kinase